MKIRFAITICFLANSCILNAQEKWNLGTFVKTMENPEKILQRTDKYILRPTLPHETSGQYTAGTIFSEGLVYFHKKWFSYYDTAVSFVGLAVSENK